MCCDDGMRWTWKSACSQTWSCVMQCHAMPRAVWRATHPQLSCRKAHQSRWLSPAQHWSRRHPSPPPVQAHSLHCHDTTECCPLNGCVTSVAVASGPTAWCGPPRGGPWPREATTAATSKMGGTLTQAAPQRKTTARPPCVEPREHWPKMTLESLFGSQGSAHRGGYRTMCNAPE